MATRFSRSVKLLPGIRLNTGKKEVALSAGARGATMTFGDNGAYTIAGISEIDLPFRNKFAGGDSLENLKDKAHLYNEAVDRVINLYRYTPTSPPTPDEFKYIFFKQKTKLFSFKIMIVMTAFIVGSISLIRDLDSARFGVLLLAAAILLPVWHMHRNYKIKKGNNEYAQKIYQGLEAGNAEIMEGALGKALDQMDWLCNAAPNFEVSADARQVFIDVDLPTIEDMPNCIKKIAETGETIENRPKKEEEIRQDYLAHIHGMLIWIAGFCFSFFPSVEKVLCSGYTQKESKQTNIVQDDYALSVWFERSKWESAKPEQVNPINYVEKFQYRRNIQNGLFEAIEPFSHFDISEN